MTCPRTGVSGEVMVGGPGHRSPRPGDQWKVSSWACCAGSSRKRALARKSIGDIPSERCQANVAGVCRACVTGRLSSRAIERWVTGLVSLRRRRSSIPTMRLNNRPARLPINSTSVVARSSSLAVAGCLQYRAKAAQYQGQPPGHRHRPPEHGQSALNNCQRSFLNSVQRNASVEMDCFSAVCQTLELKQPPNCRGAGSADGQAF